MVEVPCPLIDPFQLFYHASLHKIHKVALWYQQFYPVDPLMYIETIGGNPLKCSSKAITAVL